jgi:hypothetical protein
MQSTLTLRRFRNSSINSIVGTIALVLALAVGGLAGYLLRSPVARAVATAAQPAVDRTSQQAAPAHDMPDVQIWQAPAHDMPDEP